MEGTLLYKEDWPEAQEMFKAWWNHEPVDRPIIQAWAPQPSQGPRVAWDGWEFARQPSNPEHVMANYERWCRQTFFGGEAYPSLWINLGAGIVAAYLGANVHFYTDTVWFETPKPWFELQDLEFDEGNEWWRTTRDITKKAIASSGGRFLVGITDLGGVLDIAQSLRGKRNLVVDLFRNAHKVRGLCLKILEHWHNCFELLQGILHPELYGSSAWMGLWSPRPWYPIQCDFAYMLSPKQFEEFALPDLREQCRRLERTIYHLDGMGQIPHLDRLLSIEELDGIQWVPGAGKPTTDSPEWFPIYRRILEAGKLLVLSAVPVDRVKRLIEGIGCKGLLIQTSCDTPEEAGKLLTDAEKWCSLR